jgi:eukaryotic-like serine/threonine-protein kinase
MIGQTISHYRIIEKLDGGGMGVVYKAEDVKLGRFVALKFLPENLGCDQRALQRFEREARTASSLNHPSICTIYEVEEHDRQPVIVMELLEGESLKERIRKGPIPRDDLLDFGIQASEALEAAHTKRIIHRDIKPGNIFIVGGRRVKILDFGLAKVIPSHHPEIDFEEETLTAEGVIPGTTAYMSPEQVRGDEIDSRSDLFSLGVVLYEMAAGKRPFAGKSRVLLMNAILNEKPAQPSSINLALPGALDAIILKALEKDPSRRYQQASEIAADLKLLRGGNAAVNVQSPVFLVHPASVAVGAKSKRGRGAGRMRPPYLVALRQSGADAAVIFIHGFSGHPRVTWGAFPDALASHLAPSEWDLFSLAYASTLSLAGIWTADPDLNLLATYLHTALDQPPLDRYKRLTLIAHSMGGLVVQRTLLDHDDVLAKVRHLFLFATPSAGLTKATWVARFKRQWRDLRPDSMFIRSLRAKWEEQFGAMPPFELVSIAGDRDEFVPAASCFAPFPASCCAVVPGNHLEIVKPASTAELSVQIVLKRLAAGTTLAVSPPDAAKLPSHLTLAPAAFEPVRGRRLVLFLAAVVGVAVAILAYQFSSHRAARFHSQRPLTDKDTIVLADFTNTTGDAVFDGTLRQGIAVQLEQSPFLSLVSEGRIQQVLRLMSQPPNARLTPEVAREVCERTSSAAVLDGSIASLGTQYVLGLRARNCRTGDVLSEEQAQAPKKEDVLNILSQIASKFRTRLGESLNTVEKHNTPLETATTSSLEALKAYTAAMQGSLSTGFTDALPLLKRAVEIDPQFAMAYAVMGLFYSNIGESVLSIENTSKAYQLRDRASDRERFFITTLYDRQVTGNLEKEQQTLKLWAQTYPRDRDAHGLLSGFASLGSGQYEKSIEESNIALGIDPDFSHGYANIAFSYFFLDRPAETEKAIRNAVEHKRETPDLLLLRYYLAFVKGDTAGMDQVAALAQGKPGVEDWMLHSQALVAARAGRLHTAATISRRARDIARQAGQKEGAASYEAAEAVWAALFGSAAAARSSATAALELSNGRDVEYGAAFALALAGDLSRSQSLAGDLEKRFPEDTSVQFNYLPALRALFALNRHEPRRAIELLQDAVPYELAVPAIDYNEFFGGLYPVYVRGEAYLGAKQGVEAAAEFQKILIHRGIVFGDPIGALAQLQLGRAYAQSGDRTKAKSAYDDLLTLWKDADPAVPVLKQAKAEYAKLQ